MKLKPFYILPILVALALTVGLVFYPSAGELGLHTLGATDGTGGETVSETEPESREPTEPQPEVFTLTFVGDCTLGSTADAWDYESSFISVVGDDYDYPFANVAGYFLEDDFTMANLEGPLTEGGQAAAKDFAFRGPTAYTAILTGVEAVNLANNHILDYGYQGSADTRAALTAAGIAYGGREERFLYTTDSGLTIGVYCDDFAFDKVHIETSIAALREDGAQIVICAFHWGDENEYQPSQNQIDWAHIAIDAGADIVYGTHPHVLQPIEYYGGGVIYYSLANFSFGGNVWPSDADTAIIRQQVIRDPDGTVTLGDTGIIPCSVSSVQGQNNFQPTPVSEESESWNRIMSKLEGTYR